MIEDDQQMYGAGQETLVVPSQMALRWQKLVSGNTSETRDLTSSDSGGLEFYGGCRGFDHPSNIGSRPTKVTGVADPEDPGQISPWGE